ncbi:MAG: hypothetical protein K2X27_04270, partial [Candidatus Obscuribacterales bacterium]|nr:hypothetical protein [Candidatus Obscuribacterales bacterium]
MLKTGSSSEEERSFGMSKKVKWKLFWQETSLLIAHTLLAGFYAKLAYLLFDYYRAGFLACLSLFVSIAFAFPLLLSLLDIFALSTLAVREELIAEKALKLSLAIHEKLFTLRNAYASNKKALLAGLYFDEEKFQEAENLFAESWQIYKHARIKFPLLAGEFNKYLRLEKTNQNPEFNEIRQSLKVSQQLRIAQKFACLILTLPIIAFMLFNQELERRIALQNAAGNVPEALKNISLIASNEAMILGEFAAAKVYKDYAEAFDENPGQYKEMQWCADKALSALEHSNIKDEYMTVLLLNLKAKAKIAEGNNAEGLKLLEKSVSICANWQASNFAYPNTKAELEREKAILNLAELKRNKGDYLEAEKFYKILLGINGEIRKKSDLRLFPSDPIEAVDRLHKLQAIETKLSKKEEAVLLQEKVAEILRNSVQTLTAKTTSSAICDFGLKEASRELDVCAFMLQDLGRDTEAEAYLKEAAKMRGLKQKNLKLDALTQDLIVESSSKITNDILAVKYRASD